MTITTRDVPSHAVSAETGQMRTPWGQHAMLYLAFFLMGAEMYLVSPLLPTISTELGVSATATAGAVTAYVLAYATAGPPLGVLSDQAPRRVLIVSGLVVFLVGNLLVAASGSLVMLIIARAVTGLGAAIAAPAAWAYLAERTAPTQRGRAISLGTSIYSLGQVLGVPLGALLAGRTSWHLPFAIVGALVLVLAVVLFVRLSGQRPDGSRDLAAIIRPWTTPRISLGLITTLLLQAGRLGTYTYVGVLLTTRFGLTLDQLGLVGLLVGFASMAGSLMAGVLVDRLRAHGRHEIWLSVVSAGIFAVAVVATVLDRELVGSLAALFVWFVAGGAFYSTQQSYLSTVDPKQRASVISWNNSMMNAGIAVGTTVLGALTIGGTEFAFVAGLFGLLACLLSLGLVRVNRILDHSKAFSVGSR